MIRPCSSSVPGSSAQVIITLGGMRTSPAALTAEGALDHVHHRRHVRAAGGDDVLLGQVHELRRAQPTNTTWTSFGPCTPRISVCSMSAVRLGPVISVTTEARSSSGPIRSRAAGAGRGRAGRPRPRPRAPGRPGRAGARPSSRELRRRPCRCRRSAARHGVTDDAVAGAARRARPGRGGRGRRAPRARCGSARSPLHPTSRVRAHRRAPARAERGRPRIFRRRAARVESAVEPRAGSRPRSRRRKRAARAARPTSAPGRGAGRAAGRAAESAPGRRRRRRRTATMPGCSSSRPPCRWRSGVSTAPIGPPYTQP